MEEDDGPDDFDFPDDGSEESEAEEVPQLVNGKRKRTSAGSDLNPAKKSNKDLSPLDKLLAEKKQASDLRDKLNAKKEESENIEESEDEESEVGFLGQASSFVCPEKKIFIDFFMKKCIFRHDVIFFL